MVRLHHAAVCVVAGLVCSSAALAQGAPRTDQEVLADRIVDHGWGFELLAPGAEWLRLGEVDARRLQAEAVAGVVHLPSGVPVLVLASERRGRAGHEVVQARLDEARYDDLQVITQGPTRVAGRHANMYEVTGRWASYRMRAAGVVIERGEHLLELMSFGTLQETGPGSGFPRWDVLRLRGDAVPGRAPAPTPDRRGVGWRVRDGVLESAVCGVRLRAVETGMRLVTGREARMTLTGAEAALADDARGLQVALLAVRPRRAQVAEVAALTRDLLQQNFGAVAAVTTFTLAAPEADDGEVPFEQLSVGAEDARFEVALGVLSADGAPRVQLMAWWPADAAEAGRDALERSLGALEVLDEAPLEALVRELEALPDPGATVARTFAYRRGVLRSFEHDLTFTRPARGLWRVILDSESLAGMNGALALLEAPLLGLTGWIAVHRQVGYTTDTFHEWAASAYEGRPLGPPTARRAAGADLRVSWLELQDPPGEHMVLATAVSGERLVTFAVSGAARDLDASRDLVLSAFDGLALLDHDLRELERAPTFVRDERLGFELRRPAEGWTLVVDEEQAAIDKLGRAVRARDAAGHRLEVVAVSAPLDVLDPRSFDDYLLRAVGGDAFELRPDDMEKATLAGIPCRRLRAKGAAGKLDVFLLHHEGVSLVLCAFDPDGEGPPVAELLSCFELLD